MSKPLLRLYLLTLSLVAEPAHATNPGLERLGYIQQEGRGILSESDIASEKGTAYREDRFLNYWTCFDTKNINIQCIDMGFTSDGHMADMDFTALRSGESYAYTYRHLLGLSTCRQQLKRWKELSRHQTRACVQGQYGGTQDGTQIWSWELLKTAAGCLSYRGGPCE